MLGRSSTRTGGHVLGVHGAHHAAHPVGSDTKVESVGDAAVDEDPHGSSTVRREADRGVDLLDALDGFDAQNRERSCAGIVNSASATFVPHPLLPRARSDRSSGPGRPLVRA